MVGGKARSNASGTDGSATATDGGDDLVGAGRGALGALHRLHGSGVSFVAAKRSRSSAGAASTDGQGAGPGDGSGGDAPAEVGFQFGNRDFSCGQPAFPGVEGTIQYTLTFAPDGRYVSGRPRSRNATFQNAVEAILRTCRAAPLPPQAAQVPQTTTATFRFVTGG